jgi:hypothetical protein
LNGHSALEEFFFKLPCAVSNHFCFKSVAVDAGNYSRKVTSCGHSAVRIVLKEPKTLALAVTSRRLLFFLKKEPKTLALRGSNE